MLIERAVLVRQTTKKADQIDDLQFPTPPDCVSDGAIGGVTAAGEADLSPLVEATAYWAG